jgi:hypothetical protein
MRKAYLMAALLTAGLGTATAATAPEPVRMPSIPTPAASYAKATPWQHLYGPVPEGALPPETLVCPGAPVILNAVMVPPPVAWVGAAPEIRFEIMRGQGWFGNFADIQKNPPGFWKRLFKRLRSGYNDRRITAAADERTGPARWFSIPWEKREKPSGFAPDAPTRISILAAWSMSSKWVKTGRPN